MLGVVSGERLLVVSRSKATNNPPHGNPSGTLSAPLLASHVSGSQHPGGADNKELIASLAGAEQRVPGTLQGLRELPSASTLG